MEELKNGMISRSVLLAAYDAAHKGPPGGARKLIEDAPAIDAVPVVRCKDCMYWRETGEGFGECERFEVADSCPGITHAVQTEHDWFCADGEQADAQREETPWE